MCHYFKQSTFYIFVDLHYKYALFPLIEEKIEHLLHLENSQEEDNSKIEDNEKYSEHESNSEHEGEDKRTVKTLIEIYDIYVIKICKEHNYSLFVKNEPKKYSQINIQCATL